MASDLQDKVCIVTGAASGIGRATALALAREGARVAVADRSADGLAETARQIADAGGTARACPTDVCDEAAVARLVAGTVQAWGRLDCAFNNAGIEGQQFVPLADASVEQWHQVIAVNLTGVFLCMKHQLPHLVATRGCIVNTASVAGLSGSRFGGAYHASKHGVVGLTRAAAMEYAAAGVRVNAVAPAVIQTPMADRAFRGDAVRAERIAATHPMGRLGLADEVAQAVVWLCSPRASFTTGHVLTVDGGYLTP